MKSIKIKDKTHSRLMSFKKKYKMHSIDECIVEMMVFYDEVI